MLDMSYYERLVHKNFKNLTKNQKKIAQYLLDHPDEFAFSTIESLAVRLGVGKSTIVRLAQTLGYEGFLELRRELSTKLKNDLSLAKRLRESLKAASSGLDFVSTICNDEINNIQTTMQYFDRDSFNKAVKIFISAPTIYTMGMGISYYVSEIAAYYLNRITMRARALTYGGLSPEEQVISMKKDDAVLAISLPPYSYPIIEAAEAAQHRGVKIVSITDKPSSPIAQHSDVVFTAKTDNVVFLNTVTSVLTIVYILVAGVGLSDRTTSLTALSMFEKVESDYGTDIHADFFE